MVIFNTNSAYTKMLIINFHNNTSNSSNFIGLLEKTDAKGSILEPAQTYVLIFFYHLHWLPLALYSKKMIVCSWRSHTTSVDFRYYKNYLSSTVSSSKREPTLCACHCYFHLPWFLSPEVIFQIQYLILFPLDFNKCRPAPSGPC
jgi:hypothetical protein